MKNKKKFAISSFLVLLILNLCVTNCTFSQVNGQSLALSEVGQLSNDYYESLHVVGGIAYTACMHGFRIIDVTDLSNPIEIWHYSTPAGSHGIFVEGDLVFMADLENGLDIFNVSNLLNPTRLANYKLGLDAFDVYVAEEIAYVCNMAIGLKILDVSNLNNIRELGHYLGGGEASEVQVVREIAYLCDSTHGLKILDVSNPSNITELATFDKDGCVISVQVVKNIAYVGDWGNGLLILDVSDPYNPIELGEYEGDAYRLYVEGDFAYVTAADSGLWMFDIGNPANPAVLGQFYDGGSAKSVRVSGNYAFLADAADGLEIIQIWDGEDTVTTPGFELPVVIFGLFSFLIIGKRKKEKTKVGKCILHEK